jgi:hypothetical protein
VRVRSGQMVTLNSTMLGSATYEKGTLTVTYKPHGGSYRYFKVPRPIFDALIEVSNDSTLSVGRFFRSNVLGKFDYERV